MKDLDWSSAGKEFRKRARLGAFRNRYERMEISVGELNTKESAGGGLEPGRLGIAANGFGGREHLVRCFCFLAGSDYRNVHLRILSEWRCAENVSA